MVVRVEGLLSTTVDDEVVILNPERDNYVGLNAMGREIWELLHQPREVDELCRTLGELYREPPERIAEDVLAFLAEMLDEGLMRVVES